MGKTLFWYLFRDLLRIFALSAIVIAGIMSFGGLLRPLTRHGLDVLQVLQMWLYMMPAMMTYSLPVAAVFATSIVYGRLTADNELTACRAAGIGYGTIITPALSLGLVAAITSLLFLSFMVPFFSLQVEKVIYANVAKYIASEIQRSHEFSLGKGKPAIFAQRAFVPPSNGNRKEQVVVLEAPTMITYTRDPEDPTLRVPKTFSLASEVTLYIRQQQGHDVQVWGVLKGVTSFTRIPGSRPQVGIEQTEFGPINMPSPIAYNVKFMDIAHLKSLVAEPEKTDRVRRAIKSFIETEQAQAQFAEILSTLRAQPAEGYLFRGADQYQLLAPGVRSQVQGNKLLLDATNAPIRLVMRTLTGRSARVYECRQMRLIAEMDNDSGMVAFTFEMNQVKIIHGADEIVKGSETQVCSLPMADSLRNMQGGTVKHYLDEKSTVPGDRQTLKRETIVAINEVLAEMHARASFGLSCLVLVLVGAVMGMQFRSGDFLSAFAVSVIPALLTITLVVAGTRMATDVSTKTLNDPIVMSLGLIWVGNVLAAGLAWTLFRKLRKT